MKKLIIVLFIVLLSISLISGCAKTDGKISSNVSGTKKIGLVLSSLNNPFFMTMKNGAEEKAKELGYELIVLDSQNDPGKDLINVKELIKEGVGLILINPTDSDIVIAAIKEANIAKVPVITLDRAANAGIVSAHIASDNIAGGKMAADFINEELSGKGNVVELEGIAGTSAARERSKGFKDRLKAFPKLRIVASKQADFDRAKGLSVMETLLKEQSDVQAVFAANDEMALGAIQAIEENGKNILVIGFDGTKDGLAAVSEGKMAATVAQQPELIGSLGIITADKIIKGEKVEKVMLVELKLITE